jgi:hypothetical protein
MPIFGLNTGRRAFFSLPYPTTMTIPPLPSFFNPGSGMQVGPPDEAMIREPDDGDPIE